MEITFNVDGLDMYDLTDVLHNLWQLDYIIDNDDNEQKLMAEISRQSAERGLHYYEVTLRDKYKNYFYIDGREYETSTSDYSIISEKENPNRQEIIDFINKTKFLNENGDYSEEDIKDIKEITVREMFFSDDGCWPARNTPILK